MVAPPGGGIKSGLPHGPWPPGTMEAQGSPHAWYAGRMVETSLTPMRTVSDAAGAIDFYRRAFGALEVSRVTTPSGQLMPRTTG